MTLVLTANEHLTCKINNMGACGAVRSQRSGRFLDVACLNTVLDKHLEHLFDWILHGAEAGGEAARASSKASCKCAPRSEARSLDRFLKHGFDKEVMRLLGVWGGRSFSVSLSSFLCSIIASHCV